MSVSEDLRHAAEHRADTAERALAEEREERMRLVDLIQLRDEELSKVRSDRDHLRQEMRSIHKILRAALDGE